MTRKMIPWILLLGLSLVSSAWAADPSLIGWWKFDDGSGTSAVDSSGKGNNGTLSATPPTWSSAGVYGGCLQFDGTGNRVVVLPTWNITQVTASLWFRQDSSTGSQKDLLSMENSSGGHGLLIEIAANNTLRFLYRAPMATSGGGNESLYTTTTPAAGMWHHVAVVKSATDMTTYLDGVQAATQSNSTAWDGAVARITIGDIDERVMRPWNGLIDDVRIYDRALAASELPAIMKGGEDTTLASKPDPETEATDVPIDAALTWAPGDFAQTHNVYFGTVFDDVNAASLTSPNGVLVSQGQSTTSYDPPGLFEFGQTYYWRVDEVNAPPTDSTSFKGRTWSFTAETYGYRITTPIKATASSFSNILTGPDKTIDGSGLNALDQHSTSSSQMWLSKKNVTPIWIQYEFDGPYKLYQMWVWNQNQLSEPDNGLGAKEVTIETSTDGTTWTALGGVTEFAQAPGEETYVHNTTVDFGGVMAKFVRLTILNNWADGTKQAGLSEVRFFYIPVKAYLPTPVSGTTGVALDAGLNWRPGRTAASHEVYLGTDPNALSKVATVTEHSFALGSAGLEYGKTYYWKVNEVNDTTSPSSWTGDVWSFTAIGYAVVEDFESYDDLCNRIFWTWVDQYGYSPSAGCEGAGAGAPGNGSNASVGNDSAPYAERTIYNSGRQSMPLRYDNTKSPYYSEAYREWTTPQAWTGGGANTLRVYLRGDAAAFIETSPGAIIMNGTGTDIWNTSDQFRYSYKSLSGDGTIVARVDSVANTNEWAKAGVMIRETLDASSNFAFVATTPTPSHGVSFQCRTPTTTSGGSTDVANVTLPVWVKLSRKGNVFTGQQSADGVTWTDVAFPTAGLPLTMASNVYIGLAVCSHTATAVCGARFSNVSTTGGVSGSWLIGEIGVAQVAGNTPETCYVAVQDLGGKMKVVSSLDPGMIASGVWEEWNVPLSQFAGVNLNSVKRLIIGVGDRNAPKAGNVGKVYIDDIRLTRVSTP